MVAPVSERDKPLFADQAPTWAHKIVAVALVAVSVAGVAAWVLLAVAHVDSGYRADHVSGVRMALAQDAAEGVLYPPLYDGQRYGGTRYLPLTIVAHAGLAQVTDVTVGGRLLGYASVVALAGLVVGWAVRVRAPWPLAAALGATLLVAEPGLGAAFGMRADGVPAALQLAAVGLVAASGSVPMVVGAAALAALALSAKLTAVWAALAIGLWLLAVDRSRFAWFAGVYAGASVVLLGGFALLSDGRMVENLVGLAVAGVGGAGTAATAPNRLLHSLAQHTSPLWALVPVAAVAAMTSRLRARSGLVALSIGAQVPVLLVTFTDIGVGVNQLIDLAALAALAVALLAVRAGPRTVGGLLLALITAWVVATGVVTVTAPDAAEVLRGAPTEEPGLDDHIGPDTTVLSEDPAVPVRQGTQPVVTDPFMLARLDRLEPGAIDDLVDRIEQREFDLVVLVVPAEGNDDWWRDYHFGLRVIDAVRAQYEDAGTAEGYYLYEPRPGGD